MYRNPIRSVDQFLRKKHHSDFVVYNLSNRKYDHRKFGWRVITVEWQDHYPCPFLRYVRTIVHACYDLMKDTKVCLVVHCNAGKGRTGSLISAILLVSGLLQTIKAANNLFYFKRNIKVTQNS